MNQDMLNMWRCIVAIAHADGKVDDKERQYLLGMFDNMQRVKRLTDEDRAILERDLDVQQNPFDLLEKIESPSYRSQVLYFALYLAKVDGIIEPSEKDLIDRLHAEVTKTISPTIREQARLALKDQPPSTPSGGIAGFVDDLLNWSGR